MPMPPHQWLVRNRRATPPIAPSLRGPAAPVKRHQWLVTKGENVVGPTVTTAQADPRGVATVQAGRGRSVSARRHFFRCVPPALSLHGAELRLEETAVQAILAEELAVRAPLHD